MATVEQETFFSDFNARAQEPTEELLTRAIQFRSVDQIIDEDPFLTACILSVARDNVEEKRVQSNWRKNLIAIRQMSTIALAMVRVAPSMIDREWHNYRFQRQLYREFPEFFDNQYIGSSPFSVPPIAKSPEEYAKQLVRGS